MAYEREPGHWRNTLADISTNRLAVWPTDIGGFSADYLRIMEYNLDGAFIFFHGNGWDDYWKTFHMVFLKMPKEQYDGWQQGDLFQPEADYHSIDQGSYLVKTTIRNAAVWDEWNESRDRWTKATPYAVRLARLEKGSEPLPHPGYFKTAGALAVRAGITVTMPGEKPVHYFNVVSVISETGFPEARKLYDQLVSATVPEPFYPWPFPLPEQKPHGPVTDFLAAIG